MAFVNGMKIKTAKKKKRASGSKKLNLTFKAKRRISKNNKSGDKLKKPTRASLHNSMKAAKRAIQALPKEASVYKKAVTALKAARLGKRLKVPYGRVIPVPKRQGGFLPFLLTAVPALAALGTIAGGVSNVVRTIKAGREASEALEEAKRHNRQMEAIALGKGLYLRPYKTGMGLYVESKN